MTERPTIHDHDQTPSSGSGPAAGDQQADTAPPKPSQAEGERDTVEEELDEQETREAIEPRDQAI